MPPDLLAALVDAAPIAVVSVDSDRRILSWNGAAEELFGWSAAEVIGRPNPLIPPERAEEYPSMRATVWSGRSVRSLRTERMRRDGTRAAVLVSTSAARDSAGNIVAAIALFVDQSGMRDAESRLRRAHATQVRRAAQQQAVAAFSRRAVTDRDEDDIIRAALQHVTMALRADGCEILDQRKGALVSHERFGFEVPYAAEVPPGDAESIFDDALQSQLPVTRFLLASDFAAAPYLRHEGFRFAAAATVACHGATCVLVAYSRDHPFDLSDVYPLQAIASMLSATMSRLAVENELTAHEARLRMLLDQMPAIVWSVDANLVVTTIKGGPLAAIGGVPEETIGRSLFDPRAHGPAIDAAREALTGNSAEYRYEHCGRTYDTRLEALRDRDGTIVGAIAIALDVTARTTAERQILTSREELRRLYAKLSNVQEEERKRISRELHDDLGQQLTALRFDAAMLRDELGESASPRIADMLSLIDNAIGSVRRVATELRPAVLDDFGFRAALEQEVASFVRRTGIKANVTFQPEEPQIDIDRATTLYRIAQEALTNVARHANARHVRLAIEQCDGWLVAHISDDGCGISSATLRDTPALGLIGMRERALAFGGTVNVVASPRGGTDVVVLLPLAPP